MMDDPIKVLEAHFDSPEASRIAREWAVAIEARGWRLVHPEQGVTTKMMSQATVNWQKTGEIETMFAAAIRAAPTYATSTAKEKP